MFCYRCACCCRNNTRRSRHIKCTSPISTCTASVYCLCCNVLIQVHTNSFLAHYPRQTSNFLNGLAAWTQVQSCEKSSHLCLGSNTSHNFFHHFGCLAFTQGSSCCDVRNCFTDHLLLLSVQCVIRKLRSRSFPNGVMIDSG